MSGCDHMRCCKRAGGCGTEFACSALYAGEDGMNAIGNAAHKRNCKHFREEANPRDEGSEFDNAGIVLNEEEVERRYINRVRARTRQVRQIHETPRSRWAGGRRE